MRALLIELRDKLHSIEIQPFSLWIAYPLFAAILAIVLTPTFWFGNEINYFDLANRWVNADAFSEYHAVRDNTVGRLVSFVMMGTSIQVFGMEGAKTFLSLLLMATVPVAYVCLVRALRVDLLSAALALSVFVISPQSLLGAEYLFSTIEPKTFAYICVLLGLAAAFSDRRIVASCLLAGAVYFHFLVGAFWGAAAIAFYLVKDQHVRSVLRPFAVFLALSVPLFVAILLERMAGSGVTLAGSGLTLSELYAEVRAPHHIAPFVDGSIFIAKWLPGILAHSGIVLVVWLWIIRSDERDKSLAKWVGGLNLYILVAMFLAFLDRETHFLAMFYMFRPSALILLLSLIWGASRLLSPIWLNRKKRLGPICLMIVVVGYVPPTIRSVAQTMNGHLPLASMLSTSEADMVNWIKEHTATDAIVMIEPLNDQPFKGEGIGQWAGMERLLQRPTLVNYKFVPTDKADLSRWYHLLEWRQSVFDGNCAVIEEYPVAYLMTRTAESIDRLSACTEQVWQGEQIAILQVTPSKSARPVPNP